MAISRQFSPKTIKTNRGNPENDPGDEKVHHKIDPVPNCHFSRLSSNEA